MMLRTSLVALVVSVPLAAQVVPPRDRVTSAVTGMARVRGRVVDAVTSAPLRRAQITLTGDGSLRRQVTTNDDGRYEFTELPGGRFIVTAAKGGYLTLQYGQRRAFEPGRAVTVAEGEQLGQVDLALPRGGVIVGRVIDPFGSPVVDAEIRVERYQYAPDGQRRLTLIPPVLRSNDLGEFRAFGLMPGEYVVGANVRAPVTAAAQAGPSGPAEGLLQTYYPATPNPSEAQAVSIDLAGEVPIQIVMARGRLSRIAGIVVDSSGQPAAGADLMFVTRSNTTVGATGRGLGSVAADGSFTIPNVPPGEHFIQARRASRPGGSPVSEIANMPIVVAGEDITDFRVALTAGATVAGRVQWDGQAPRTASAGAALRVVPTAADGRPALLGLSVPEAAANGIVGPDSLFRMAGLVGAARFEVTGVPPQWTVKAVLAGNADITDKGVDTASLGPNNPLLVILTDRFTTVTGSVRTVNGQGGDEYVVVVLPDKPVDPAVAPRYTRTVRPDQRGDFRIQALPPGRYVAIAVAALEQGSEWDPAVQRILRAAGRRFVMQEGQALSLTLDLMQ